MAAWYSGSALVSINFNQQRNTTNLKDEYFGFASESAAVLYWLKEVVNANDFIRPIQDAVVTVAQYGHSEAIAICMILTRSYNNK